MRIKAVKLTDGPLIRIILAISGVATGPLILEICAACGVGHGAEFIVYIPLIATIAVVLFYLTINFGPITRWWIAFAGYVAYPDHSMLDRTTTRLMHSATLKAEVIDWLHQTFPNKFWYYIPPSGGGRVRFLRKKDVVLYKMAWAQ